MPNDFIALDWGTSSFRAYLVGRDGTVRDSRAGAHGIMSVAEGHFEQVFERQVEGWSSGLSVLASGMITSRQGWREVPYAAAPAGLPELAAGLTRFRTSAGREIALVPGMSYRAEGAVPDVIRGEETQIMGATEAGSGLFVTRGTHCKWVQVVDGRITDFATFMTGELYSILRQHSILGRLMTGEVQDGTGFSRGVKAGLGSARAGAGLLHSLFSVRSLGLFGDVPGEQLSGYLSGLLIGSEIAGARALFNPDKAGVTLIGDPALCAAFATALSLTGVRSQLAPQDAAVRGLAKIGRRAGVIP